MRRPVKGKPEPISTFDIKKDLTEKQLAAIGAAALAFNVLEEQIDELLFAVTRTPRWLFPEVSSRIHGLEGKVAIIKAGIDDGVHFPDLASFTPDLADLKTSIDKFLEFKRIRDAIIHSRIINAAIGIGMVAKQRGKSPYEVLLQAEALESYYNHAVTLERVLASGANLLSLVIAMSEYRVDHLYRRPLEERARSETTQFQHHLQRLRSLKPLPQFPDEAEIQKAVALWREALRAQAADWIPPLSQPVSRAPFHPQAGSTTIEPVLPPREGEKKE